MMIRHSWGVLMGAMLLGGCASSLSVVLPRSDGAYEIIATGETEVGAYQRADRRAEKTCGNLDKQYRVHDRQTRYQGALSPEAVKLSRSLSNAISASTSAMVPSAASDEDYKATILITCV
ncbi:MAG: hypothetical protein KBC91_04145 [Candidatus Omnitrophica bacterium]|nr:hypothetical protein [Candidatus Omnitrophota bacterium]